MMMRLQTSALAATLVITVVTLGQPMLHSVASPLTAASGATKIKPLPHRISGAKEERSPLSHDSAAAVDQIPENFLGPPGQKLPEVGPAASKTDQGTSSETRNTANCTGANANSPQCYTATQQTRGK